MGKSSLLVIGFSLLMVGCASRYQSEPSANFDGRYFRNTVIRKKSPWDLMKLAWGVPSEEESGWPAWIDAPQYKVPEPRVKSGISYAVINHSTVLIQVDGINILTDPVYSERVSPFSFIGPGRHRPPGIKFEDLPDIDIVLISHDHYDHLDTETLIKLKNHNKTGNAPLVLLGLGNDQLLNEIGVANHVTLDWDQAHEAYGLKFRFVECQHRSGRGLFDQDMTLWGSFVIETSAGKIYFAGDTGYSPHFKIQGQQYGEFALAFLPIGAYEPRWFMSYPHVNPEESAQAHLDLNARQSVGIHFGTFRLTYEPIDQPEKDLAAALAAGGIPQERFLVPVFGQSVMIKPDQVAGP